MRVRPGPVVVAIPFVAWGLVAPASHVVAQDGGAAAAERFLALEAHAQLLVSDGEAATEALITWTEGQGGYFVERSLERVELRVPADAFDELREVARTTAEEIITYNPSAQAEIALSAQAADIPDRVPSSFDWLNSLGLYDFIGEVAR